MPKGYLKVFQVTFAVFGIGFKHVVRRPGERCVTQSQHGKALGFLPQPSLRAAPSRTPADAAGRETKYPAAPIDIIRLCANRIMQRTNVRAHLIEQARWWCGLGRRNINGHRPRNASVSRVVLHPPSFRPPNSAREEVD